MVKQILSSMMVLGLVFSLASTATADTTPQDSINAINNGSYRQTCQKITVTDTGLRATCRKMDGSWVNTSLSLIAGRCSEIENIDGRLICSSAD